MNIDKGVQRMQKFKGLFLTSIIAFLLLFVTACGGGGKEEGTEEKDTVAKTEENAKPTNLILATTTSTQDSGLLDELIPLFEEQHDYNVQTIAVGTGQALEMGTKGEADVLLVHAPEAEEEVVANGDAINRKRVMYNDYIIVGPNTDPAGIKGLPIAEAFEKIMTENAVFVSRGDDSGTHKKEMGIWKKLEKTPSENASYMETGQGMGATLQIANEKDGYTLTDRATFLAQEDNLTNLQIVVENEEDLLNVYHVMQVNHEKHDKVNAEGAQSFVEFMVSDETQKVIEEFGKEEFGQALFTPYTE
jgi:tungstate transport system substrate-binding protein